ncbi:Ku protein [Streptomyces sp. 7N604]|uniref:Ku protein n=1 Tax=Streptomyces sp. 7N604 TaxID=3457415 RepID=UPI003FD496E7
MRDALNRSGEVAVGKVALRGRETLAAIRIHEGALTVHTMLWPDEIRPHEGMAPDRDVDLMAALEQSVRKTQEGHGGQPKATGGKKSTDKKP